MNPTDEKQDVREWPRHVGESFRLKIVQRLATVPYDRRKRALQEAEYNVLRIPRRDVYLDFATNKGNAGLTDKQLSALMIGDEAYAGSENFYALERACAQVFGKAFTIPTHQGRGAEHLLLRGMVNPGQRVVTNGHLLTLQPLGERLGIPCDSLLSDEAFDPCSDCVSKADMPLGRLEHILQKGSVGLVLLSAALPQLGGQPLSLENLSQCAALASRHHVPVVLDASLLSSSAYLSQSRHSLGTSLAAVIRQYADQCDLLYLSGREDAGCHTGGLLATNDEACYRRLRDLVVVYEGLHTYGGQAGRDMQVLAQGLQTLGDEHYLTFRWRQMNYLAQSLEKQGYRLFHPLGLSGVLLDCRNLPMRVSAASDTGAIHPGLMSANLSAILYLVSGCRLRQLGQPRMAGPLDLLGIFVPRRSYTERHIEYLIESLQYVQHVQIAHSLTIKNPEETIAELIRYQAEPPFLISHDDDYVPTFTPEPYFIKVVEPFTLHAPDARAQAIQQAGYNTFLLRSKDVGLDLLTDSGTAAMSTHQWGKMLEVQESELGSDGFSLFDEQCRNILGFRYVLPTHQGRAAEHILSQALIRKGQYVLNNMYFTTTREHQERAGGVFVDLIRDEAYDPHSFYLFKGDINTAKLKRFIETHGADAIAYLCLETNVNMAGGQPISLAATREVSAICRYHHIPLFFDATRVAENAYLIKTREPAYATWSIQDIIRELMSLGDGCTVSAKKDVLVNIGGILALNHPAWYERCVRLCATFEGTPWSGGLAGRDLAAMAVGLEEMTDYDYIRSRVEQVRYLWTKVHEAGVPVVQPPGGHAVFLDAKEFLPHIPQDEFPAQRLAAALYETSGIRGMERGQVSAGRDPVTGQQRPSKLELVRLTIPRRVYTYSHMDVIAEGVIEVFRRRDQLKGLRLVYEPPTLRFFTARFELL